MRIVDNVRPDRQTVMFSATFPRAMEALARRILLKPLEVQVGGRSVVCSDVEQHVVSHLPVMSVFLYFWWTLCCFDLKLPCSIKNDSEFSSDFIQSNLCTNWEQSFHLSIHVGYPFLTIPPRFLLCSWSLMRTRSSWNCWSCWATTRRRDQSSSL